MVPVRKDDTGRAIDAGRGGAPCDEPVVGALGKPPHQMDAGLGAPHIEPAGEVLLRRLHQRRLALRVQPTHPAKMAGEVAFRDEVGDHGLLDERAVAEGERPRGDERLHQIGGGLALHTARRAQVCGDRLAERPVAGGIAVEHPVDGSASPLLGREPPPEIEREVFEAGDPRHECAGSSDHRDGHRCRREDRAAAREQPTRGGA